MFCVAQVREWRRHLDELEKLDGKLVILTSDPAPVVRGAVRSKKLDRIPFVLVESDQWARWDIANERRPEIPKPTTWLVAPDGKVLWTKTSADYSTRVDASRILRRIEADREAKAAAARD